MQINSNYRAQKPSFGMAYHVHDNVKNLGSEAVRIIKKMSPRMGNMAKENKVDVVVFAQDSLLKVAVGGIDTYAKGADAFIASNPAVRGVYLSEGNLIRETRNTITDFEVLGRQLSRHDETHTPAGEQDMVALRKAVEAANK